MNLLQSNKKEKNKQKENEFNNYKWFRNQEEIANKTVKTIHIEDSLYIFLWV